MAIQLINVSRIRSGSELVLPGTPVVFGIRSTSAFVDSRAFYAEMGYTNRYGQLGVDPRVDTKLLAGSTVEYHAPERKDSGTAKTLNLTQTIPRVAEILGNGNVQAPGIFEVTAPIEDYYSPVMASVTFRLVDSFWTQQGSTPYWSNKSDVLPLYAGLEYGIKNTGIFAYLRNNNTTGSMVVGGPAQADYVARPGQLEIPDLGWDEIAQNNGLFTIFFLIDPESMQVRVWKQGTYNNGASGDSGPKPVGSPIPIHTLGTFQPSDSFYSQRRDAAGSADLRFFFGHGGASGDVSVVDFALFRFFAPAAAAASPYLRHAVSLVPDVPLIFKSEEGALPTAALPGRWDSGISAYAPAVRFWYQPGRKSVPLYTEITKSGAGTSFLYREEPTITVAGSGFSVEAWMSAAPETAELDTGIGFRVHDGAKLYRVAALNIGGVRTIGIQRTDSPPGTAADYFVPHVGVPDYANTLYAAQPVLEIDYTGLRLVRLTVDRRLSGDIVSLFVEDPDVPVLHFLASLLPDSTATGSVAFGHFLSQDNASTLNVAALTVASNHQSTYEDGLGNPPVGFYFHYVDNQISNARFDWRGSGNSAPLWIIKPAPRNPGNADPTDTGYMKVEDSFSYLRGCQVDFRAVVTGGSDMDAASTDTDFRVLDPVTGLPIPIPPNSWTGVGVTVYLGNTEATKYRMIRVGFFDCGIGGRKVGLIPSNGVEDIIHQTARGCTYSADWDWSTPSTLRLVYRPYKSVELWDSTLIKGRPLISIPWADFEFEEDTTHSPSGVAFGAFNAEAGSTSEWDYLRWSISAGYEVALSQDIVYLSDVQDGRVFLKINAGEIANV